MKTIFGTHDQTSYSSNRQRRQHMGGKDQTNTLGSHLGPDIFHFIKAVINVHCLSSVALPCVFRFAVFLVCHIDFALISTHFVRWGYDFT